MAATLGILRSLVRRLWSAAIFRRFFEVEDLPAASLKTRDGKPPPRSKRRRIAALQRIARPSLRPESALTLMRTAVTIRRPSSEHFFSPGKDAA
jgi:hypothetical protein